MYQKILVPIDGSETSARGLDEAIKLGKITGARLRLIHVIDGQAYSLAVRDGYANAAAAAKELRDAATTFLSRGEAQVRSAGLEVDTVLLDGFEGRVSDLVLKQANDWTAELIVLGTHGRRGVGRLLIGSDAENIVRGAQAPVLLIRAGAHPAKG